MKWLATLLAIHLLVGCDDGGDVTTLESVEQSIPCRPTAPSRGEQAALDHLKGQNVEEQQTGLREIVGFERVRRRPSFENALKSDGDYFVARAFVIEKTEDGGISVIEDLCGRVPSDPEEYISRSRPSGRYLVGSLTPSGGYGISASARREERFCLRLVDGGEFLQGKGVSGLLRFENVKMKLTPIANRMEQGGR